MLQLLDFCFRQACDGCDKGNVSPQGFHLSCILDHRLSLAFGSSFRSSFCPSFSSSFSSSFSFSFGSCCINIVT